MEESATDVRRHRRAQMGKLLMQTAAEADLLRAHHSEDLALALLGCTVGQGDLHFDAGALVLEQRAQVLQCPLIHRLHGCLSQTSARCNRLVLRPNVARTWYALTCPRLQTLAKRPCWGL